MRSILPALLIVAAACGGGDATDPIDPPRPNPTACEQARLPHLDQPTLTGDIFHVHDPAILRDGEYFYVYSTNDGIPIRRSRDLIRWERLGRVFPAQLPPWARSEVPGVEAPWAPDLSYFNGRYHLYYSLSTFGSQRSVIGLATNSTLDPTRPGYAWQDHGKVLESRPNVSDNNAIDANIAFDENGTPWISWGSFWGGIRMRRIDPATGMLSAADAQTYALAARPGSTAVEAPFIIRHGAHFYLFVSFDTCCRGAESTYNIRVGRATSITGPYVDRAGTPMMLGGGTLVLRGYGRIAGPGHADVLSLDGRELLVHHFYDTNENGVPKLQIRPLAWSEDGWPVAGHPIASMADDAPPAGLDVTGSWAYAREGNAPTRIQLLAGGRLERCDGSGTWSYAAPWLRLTWTDANAAAGSRVDVVRITGGGSSFAGRTDQGLLLLGHRAQGN